MAEKADDRCPCTHPELPQFEWVSKIDATARQGIREWSGKSHSRFAALLVPHFSVLTQC